MRRHGSAPIPSVFLLRVYATRKNNELCFVSLEPHAEMEGGSDQVLTVKIFGEFPTFLEAWFCHVGFPSDHIC